MMVQKEKLIWTYMDLYDLYGSKKTGPQTKKDRTKNLYVLIKKLKSTYMVQKNRPTNKKGQNRKLICTYKKTKINLYG